MGEGRRSTQPMGLQHLRQRPGPAHFIMEGAVWFPFVVGVCTIARTNVSFRGRACRRAQVASLALPERQSRDVGVGSFADRACIEPSISASSLGVFRLAFASDHFSILRSFLTGVGRVGMPACRLG